METPSPRRCSRCPYQDRRRRWSPYHDRPSRNGKPYGSRDDDDSEEDDEELKGLSYFEYRRLKRQKLRKKLKNCIWTVTPSPPRSEREQSELFDEPDGASDSPVEEEEEEEKKEETGKEKWKRAEPAEGRYSDSSEDASERRSDEDSGSESESLDDSLSDDEDNKRRKRRSRRSGSSRRRKSKRSTSSRKKRSRASSSTDESEESDSSPRPKKKKTSTRSKKSKQSKSESSSDSDAIPAKVDSKKPEIDPEALMFKELIEAQKKPVLENEPLVAFPSQRRATLAMVVHLGPEKVMPLLSMCSKESEFQEEERKENQVYSAEDKRALAMFNYEEKSKREHKVMADLQRLVQRHIGQDVGPSHDPFALKASDAADG
uniref:NF-kappa-B-activating protein C-terminal domain-containing protein n=1 Tax=Ananas comosus var. bracteatus TaxID=296719 RepID=A0A6V7P5I7_ANACO|nr:unnamed protein product [Ananas comosus var. bracteatus]